MTTQRQTSIEFHDSGLEAISYYEDGLRLHLSCGLYMSEGRPGVDGGLHAVQDVVFYFPKGSIEGYIGDLPAEILKGGAHIGSEHFEHMLDLPCDVSGEAASLTLFLYPDYRKLHVSGDGLEVTVEGEPECVTEWSPRK